MMLLSVLDTDGTVVNQGPIKKRLEDRSAQRVNLRDIGHALRLWTSTKIYRQMTERLPLPPTKGSEVFFIGSGDYHHLSAALIARYTEPMTLIHFDNHTDGAWCLPQHHCGGWVNKALEMSHIFQVYTIGCCSDDISVLRGDLQWVEAFETSRLNLFPLRETPSRISKQKNEIGNHKINQGMIEWDPMPRENWSDFIDRLVSEIAGRKIWISIDKDVLLAKDAFTNWDQGRLSMSDLEFALCQMADSATILGVDICGDYAPSTYLNPFKRIEAHFEQPRSQGGKTLTNEQTNERLLYILESVL